MSLALAILYALTLIVLGLLARARSRDREGTYLAGRRLGAGLVAATLTATAVGGSATVVLARFVYEHGVSGIWLDLPLGLSLLVLGAVLAGPIRATGAFSLPDLAGRRFGAGFRRTAGLLVVLAEIAWFALLVRAAAPFLMALAPLDGQTATLALAALFVFYTTLGGQAAVAWTDGFQLVLVGIFGLALPAAAAWFATEGLTGLPPAALRFPTGENLDALAVLGLVALVGLPGLVGGDVYAKILSARDIRAARRGAVAAGLMKIVAAGLVCVLALSAHLLPITITDPGQVLTAVVQHVLPSWLWPLVALGFLAAMMSSADSVLLTGATVVDVDLLPPGAATHPRLRSGAILLSLGALGTALAMALPDVVELMKWAYTVFAAGAPLPILMGFQRRVPIPPGAATAALIVGGAVAVVARLVGSGRPEPVLLGLGASAAILAFAALRSWLRER